MYCGCPRVIEDVFSPLPCVKVARSCLGGCELGGDAAEGDGAGDL